jgi:hypothetical protein
MISSRQRYNARLAAIALEEHEATCAPVESAVLREMIDRTLSRSTASSELNPGRRVPAPPSPQHRARRSERSNNRLADRAVARSHL